jgi:DNA-directed RNA polymerase specialized sigma24 family protein
MTEVEQQGATLTRGEVSAQFDSLSGPDWRRALKFARVVGCGLVGLDAEDLLQEAVVRLLAGERTWPQGVAALAVISNAMRSIASNWRKRTRTGPIDESLPVAGLDAGRDPEEGPVAIPVNSITPERLVSGEQQLALIERAVADDDEVGLLVTAWAEGLRGDEAIIALGWNVKTHEAARKRTIRRLDKLERTGD